MKVLVSGASGLIGPALTNALRGDGHEVVRLVRREPRAGDEVRWDPAGGVLDLEAIAGTQAAVNLSGLNVGDRRWNDDVKRELRSSRVDSTRTLATALAVLDPLPEVLLNASAMGFYGDRGDEELTEQSAAGAGFFPELVTAWEAATRPAQVAGIRVVTMRSGLVMSASEGAFGRLLPLFRWGLGGKIGDGSMWWSWITLDDEVRAMRFLLANDVDGPVNLTSPDPVPNVVVTKALGRALHRPTVLTVPRVALRVALGEFAREVAASARVMPRMLQDAGFEFHHPDIDSATRWLAGAVR